MGPNRKIALGHSNPGYTYGQVVELFDLRLYVHSTGPLSAPEIVRIAGAPTQLAAEFKCVLVAT